MHIGQGIARVAMVVTAITALACPASAAVAASSQAARNTSFTSSIIKSDYFAGYVTGPGPSGAKATFKVPKITCTSATSVYTPGVVVISPDTGPSEAGIVADCFNDHAAYVVQFVIFGAVHQYFAVQPGNTITATISQSVTGLLGTVTDVTTGATQTVTGAGGGVTQVFVGAVAGTDGSPVEIPTFKTDQFTKVSVGGKALGLASPTEMEIVSGKIVRLQPSAITGGNAFTLVFKHN